MGFIKKKNSEKILIPTPISEYLSALLYKVDILYFTRWDPLESCILKDQWEILLLLYICLRLLHVGVNILNINKPLDFPSKGHLP